MFLIGYSVGVVSTIVLLLLGFSFGRSIYSNPSEGGAIEIPEIRNPFQRAKKKTPKSVSEQEQWRREQKDPPLDPGL